ncbi:MAG: mechanosensitive ion channel [Desulfocapsaceae bacterium]|nr:mechanosensitive ion channel [Desulfocapsaceae bacterium]
MSVTTDDAQFCRMEKLVSTLVKIAPDAVGLFIFVVVAMLTFTVFIWTSSPFVQLFFMATLMTISLIRIIILLSQVVFSPTILQFRVLPVHCGTANTLHKLLVWTGSYMIIAVMFSVVVFKLGAQKETLQLLQMIFASLILFITAAATVVYRKKIREQILLSAEEEPTWGRKKFSDIWHILALLYIFVLWFLIIHSVDSPPETRSRGAFFLSFFIVPIWLVMDRLVQWIVQFSLKILKIYDGESPTDLSPEELEQYEKGRRMYLWCRPTARVFLVFILGIWLASLWGISFPIFSKFTNVFFDAAIILTLALLFWQFISSWIERKIAESIPEEEEEKEDDEWGGAASRGRSYTLLPMIRKFVGSVLVVMVTMTVLSSMGVDIGPLLAGAGVIGLAVGFGAQKLVADMFSGFFYLLDDAFRVGEYLEAGDVSGIVENITLRNVMLRHHRGMLQIVPHSDLGSITNFMRGGIVVKFNLDFPYDADIDKIRKVIKKVGQAMLEDEELGKDFIRPVKSQGVREISNSVMTIRVKFTAQPGAHFVIRREAFKRITEALQAKGIHYAHRKVIVDLPSSASSNATDEQIQAAGAAAMQQIEEMENSENAENRVDPNKSEML